MPSPHSLRLFFFAATRAAFLPFGQLSVSVSVSVVSGRVLPFVWLILKMPSKNFAVPPCPAAVISTVPLRASTDVPTRQLLRLRQVHVGLLSGQLDA